MQDIRFLGVGFKPCVDTIPEPQRRERWPDRTVADGRLTLGFIFENEDGSLTATGSMDEPLGSFADQEAARRAIVDFAKGSRP